MLEFTPHAERRLRQRGLSTEHAALVIDNGTAINTAGAEFYYLPKKEIPAHLPGAMHERLSGVIIVLDPETRDVLTVYRNPNALKDIRKKVPYDRYSAHRKALWRERGYTF